MGTGGAIRKAIDDAPVQDEFLVTYGDSYLPIDYGAVWKRFLAQPLPALMTVLENHEKWDRSNACFDGTRVSLYDKWTETKPPQMRFVDYGLSALRKSMVQARIAAGEKMDLARLFHTLSLEGQLAGYEVKTRFYEIGSPQGLADLREYVKIQEGLSS
jgi:NDP-sugar pyrophosphorylase family protein